MAKWTRIHMNSASDTLTNAYVDLEQYGFVRVVFDSVTSLWQVRASIIDNSETTTLFGQWSNESDASKALYCLLEGSDLSQF
jgi:hypothetical protein